MPLLRGMQCFQPSKTLEQLDVSCFEAVPQLEVFLQGDDRLPNFSRSFRWGQRSLERFDRLRRWLLLLWNNCVFACITFGASPAAG